jgi:hypothetical protein
VTHDFGDRVEVGRINAGRFSSLQPDGSRVVTTFEQDHHRAFWASVKG